jgi:hypothetical protein
MYCTIVKAYMEANAKIRRGKAIVHKMWIGYGMDPSLCLVPDPEE